MPKNRTSNGKNCFPEHPKEALLPRTVLREEIVRIIDNSYQEILNRIASLFSSTSYAHKLQKARGHLADFQLQLKRDIGIEVEGAVREFRTYGDLMNAGRKAHALLRKRSIGNPEYRDRRMDPEVVAIVNETIKKISLSFQSEMAPEAKEDAVLEVPTQIATKKEVSVVMPSKEHSTTTEVPDEQIESHDVLAFLNENTELRLQEFPQPIHGYWDLDKLAQHHKNVAPNDPIPHWIRQLTEAEATRMLILLSESSAHVHREKLIKFFGSTQSFSKNTAVVSTLIQGIRSSPSYTKGMIEQWISRHAVAGFAETERKYVHKPSYLRFEEQKQLMKPNLRRIVEHHFSRVDVPLAHRRLVDIGTWDGNMPKALSMHFGEMIGVEPDQKRFELLTANPTPNLYPLNTDMQSILGGQCPYDLHGHAFLFSHVLYFLQQEEADLEALRWAMDHAENNGIIAIVLNDSTLEPASRAHLRKTFGVRESAGTPYYYQKFFQQNGIVTCMMRPTLHAKAHTPEGKVAMRELMQLMLPGETRHNQAGLDAYQRLIDLNGGIFKHTLNILIAYKNPEDAPVQKTERKMLLDFPCTTAAPHHQKSPQKNSESHASLYPSAVEDQSLEPIGHRLLEMEPAEILGLVDMIGVRTWGEESKVRSLLTQLGVEWSRYRLWIDGRNHYEAADRVLRHVREHASLPTEDRLHHETVRLVLQSLQREHRENGSFEQYLHNIGLYARYCKVMRKTSVRKKKKPTSESGYVSAAKQSPHVQMDKSFVHVKGPKTAIHSQTIDVTAATESKVTERRQVLTHLDHQLLSLRARLIDNLEQNGNSRQSTLLEMRALLIDSIGQ